MTLICVWVVRELSRFVEKIVIAVLIAIVITELRTLISGGRRTATTAAGST